MSTILALPWWQQQADLLALLIFCYVVGIQYTRPYCRVLGLLLIPGFLIDVWFNYTWLALLTWDVPRGGRAEVTFSLRLNRLVFDKGWRGSIARTVARVLNMIDPKRNHIPTLSQALASL